MQSLLCVHTANSIVNYGGFSAKQTLIRLIKYLKFVENFTVDNLEMSFIVLLQLIK